MILTALAVAQSVAPPAFTLQPERPAWSASFLFSGPSSVTLELDPSPLDGRSALTLWVDERPWKRLPLTGTVVPLVVPLPDLQGRHTLALRSDLRDPESADCHPGNPWVTVQLEVDADPVVERPAPPALRAALAGQALNLQGGDDLLWLEAASWLRSWGATLDGDVWSVQVAASEMRMVDLLGDVLVVTGDAAFVRQLADSALLERCEDWPCRVAPGPLERSEPSTSLAGLGFPRGLTLSGQAEQPLVFATGAPLESGALVFEVHASGEALDAASTLSFWLEDQPLGTWSVADWEGSRVVEVALPAWARQLDPLPVRVRADLHPLEAQCGRMAQAPWIRLAPESGLRAVPEPGNGLAGRAQDVRGKTEARVCLKDPLTLGGATLLASLRPRGGWVADCTAADVVLSSDAIEGLERGPFGLWGAVAGDPVPASDARWVVHATTPLWIQPPRVRSTVRSVPWTALQAEVVVSTPGGWSALGANGETVLLPTGLVEPSDEARGRGSIDLLFGALVVLLMFAGGVWIWRSRGDRSGWTEASQTGS